MSQHQHLYVTVGTSLFTNVVEWAKDVKHPWASRARSEWNRLNNRQSKLDENSILIQLIRDSFLIEGSKIVKKSHGFTREEAVNKTLIWKRKEKISGDSKMVNYFASAEIQSIKRIQMEAQWQDVTFDLFLITTDTEVSNAAAELLKHFYKQNPGIGKIGIDRISGLQVRDEKDFVEQGFQKLVGYLLTHQLYEIKEKGVKKFKTKRRIPPGGIINVTGGFKGIVPVLGLVGQLLEMPIAYTYENSEALIIIPPLPMGFDWTHMELYRYFLTDQTTKYDSETKKKIRVFDASPLKGTEAYSFFLNEVLTNRFMSAKKIANKTYYENSFLGELLIYYIEKVFPISAKNFGLPIEFLYYEYFLNHAFEWKEKHFTKVIHNKKMGGKDFDFVLEDESGELVVAEVTSYGQLWTSKSGNFAFKKQLLGQIEFFKSTDQKIPVVYLLLLYGFKIKNEWDKLEQGMNFIWEKIKSIGVQEMQVFTLDLPITASAKANNKNIYSNIYQKKITDDKGEWEKGEKNKYGNPLLYIKNFNTFKS